MKTKVNGVLVKINDLFPWLTYSLLITQPFFFFAQIPHSEPGAAGAKGRTFYFSDTFLVAMLISLHRLNFLVLLQSRDCLLHLAF